MNIFLSIFKIFILKEKINFFFLIFISFIATILETLSIGLLIPLLSSLFNSTNEINSIFFFINLSNFQDIYLKYFTINNLIILIVLVYVIKNIFLVFVVFWSNKYTADISIRLTYKLLKEYLHRPFLFHQKTNSSDLIRNVSQEVLIVQLTIMSFVNILLEFLLVFFIFIMLVSINPNVTILITIFSLFTIIFYWLVLKKYIQNLGKIRLDSNGQLIKSVIQSFGAIKEIKLSSTENKFLKVFNKYNILSKKTYFLYIFYKSLPRYYYELLGIFILLSIFFFLKYQSFSNEYILTLMSIYAVSFIRLIPSLNRLSSEFLNFKFRFASLKLMISELTDKSTINQNQIIEDNDFIKKNDFDINKISFDCINFKYEKKIIFKNFNLKIKKNEFIGIYGKSGRGKSTLINILSGLIIPNKGTVYVNDNSIHNDYNLLKLYQSNIGYVSQNTYILDGSITENITMNSNIEKINIPRLEEVIKSCQIEELYEFKDKDLGEMGSKLSGGQIQRIGIARSMYINPKLLILDEPTSSLDVETENRIINMINSFKTKKIIILISHKKELLSKCDRIIDLDNIN